MLKNLFLFLTLLPGTLFAQSVITGRITSLANKNAVPAASVFLSNTSVGGTSATDGTFTLHNVKNGQYDLVVSCVGYEQFHQTVTVNGADIKLDAIELMPKITALKEVTIKPLSESARANLIRQFTVEFFGHTPNAADCTLQNPEMVNISVDESGAISAGSSDFLVIINNALGYKLKYLLSDFLLDRRNMVVAYSGSFMFEPLIGNSAQQKKWQKNRIAAYLGSDMHFLRACIANDVTDEGFTVKRLVRKLNPSRPPDSLINAKVAFFGRNAQFTAGFKDSLKIWADLSRLPKYSQVSLEEALESKDYIKITQVKGIYAFGYHPDCLSITYKRQDIGTIITFNQPFSFFDNNGVIFNPLSNKMEGNWSVHRVADLLPVDYELPTSF